MHFLFYILFLLNIFTHRHKSKPFCSSFCISSAIKIIILSRKTILVQNKAAKVLLCSVCNVFFLSDTKTCNQHKENNTTVFTIYKESLLCENSTYKYDLHNKINM